MQDNRNNRTFTINCSGRLLIIDKPIVMGIINATPNSFFENSRQQPIADAMEKAGEMIAAGATILDIGGQSTKPGSEPITADEEIARTIPIIQQIAQAFPEVFISIDTYYSTVAGAAIKVGATIVNDISGGLLDKEMIPTVAKLGVPYICMHMQGVPATMQQDPQYENITTDILDYFIERIDTCKKAGIKDIIIDPGFGFGKTITHNYQLLKSLSTFKILEKPLLIGVSRKGMIYKPLGITANDALNGTSVVNTIALMAGGNIVRVHDVKEAKEVIDLVELYQTV